MIRIGITGGIGSGKTTVSDYLRKQGYEVIDADQVGRNLLSTDSQVLQNLVQVYGESILDSTGHLDRKALASKAFQSKETRIPLNEITHRGILRRIREELARLEARGTEIAFVDAALLLESGLDKDVNQIWLVTAERDVRMDRVSNRDGSSDAEILARMEAQMPEDEKEKSANQTLKNDGTKSELFSQIEKLLKEYD